MIKYHICTTKRKNYKQIFLKYQAGKNVSWNTFKQINYLLFFLLSRRNINQGIITLVTGNELSGNELKKKKKQMIKDHDDK